MKKIIFIDWNRTLSFDLFWGHLKDSAHPNHAHLQPIDEWLFAKNRALIRPWMLGELSLEDISSRMSGDIGISEDVIIEELRHSCEIMQFCIVGLEDLILAIRKRGVKVIVATDNMDTFSRFTVPALKLNELFDGIINSYDIGHLKDEASPADRIIFFDQVLAEYKLNYSDVVLLDDSPDSSGKYKKLGFDRIIIDSPDTLQRVLEEYAYGS